MDSSATGQLQVIPLEEARILEIYTVGVEDGPIYVDNVFQGNAPLTVIVVDRVHTVSFGDVEGWTTPDPRTVTVTAGETLQVTGTYLQPGLNWLPYILLAAEAIVLVAAIAS